MPFLVWVLFKAAISLSGEAALSPKVQAADFYTQRQEYAQAKSLWRDLLEASPDNLTYAFKLGELTLMFEGHLAASQVLQKPLGNWISGKSFNLNSAADYQTKILFLQSTFISDEAQGLYEQASYRLKEGGCAAAVDLLNRSLTKEPGNLRVLLDKAKCEQKLGNFPAFRRALSEIVELNPLDADQSALYAESAFQAGDSSVVIASLSSLPANYLTARAQLALAYALESEGRWKEALTKLIGLTHREALGTFQLPYFFLLGKIYLTKVGGRNEGQFYLEQFRSQAERSAEVASWDPYQIQNRIEEAKAIMKKSAGRER